MYTYIVKIIIVFCLQVIEHVDEPLNFLSSCCTCLDTSKETAPSLILSTINRYRNRLDNEFINLTLKLFRNSKSYAIAILGAEYILGMVPVGINI